MNVLANCCKHYLVDLKDPSKKTPMNPQGYVLDLKWTEFLKDWATLLDSPIEVDYTHQLVKFHTH
jgi:hypothetical protein